MKIETLTYSLGDMTFQGYLADPEGSDHSFDIIGCAAILAEEMIADSAEQERYGQRAGDGHRWSKLCPAESQRQERRSGGSKDGSEAPGKLQIL